MDQNPAVKLPIERLAQLKAIGAALDLPSLADVVGHLIRAEIARGTIEDTLPGIAITRVGDGLDVGFDESPPTSFALDAAHDFAAALRGAADGTGPSVVNMDADFAVERVGNGVKATTPWASGKAKMLNRDVARDLARLIESAARNPAL